MTSLPFLDDVLYHATFHSQAWWFNSIGNGTRTGLPPPLYIWISHLPRRFSDGFRCRHGRLAHPGAGRGAVRRREAQVQR
jgi:hypothetical protein